MKPRFAIITWPLCVAVGLVLGALIGFAQDKAAVQEQGRILEMQESQIKDLQKEYARLLKKMEEKYKIVFGKP